MNSNDNEEHEYELDADVEIPDNPSEDDLVEALDKVYEYHLEELDLGGSPGAQSRRAKMMVRDVARVYHPHRDDLEEMDATAQIKAYAASGDMAQDTLFKVYENKLEDLGSEEFAAEDEDDDSDTGTSGGKTYPETFVRDHVDHVVKHVPSDESAVATYTWVLEDGSEFSTEREHLAPNSFAHAIYDYTDHVVEEYHSDGFKESDKSWTSYIKRFIESNKVEEDNIGDLTYVIEHIESQLNGRTPVSEIEEAAYGKDPYIEDPDDEYMWVPNRVIKDALAEYETVQYQDLTREMHSRGIKGPKNSKPMSVGDGPNGGQVRFWQITQDFADLNWGDFDE